MDNLNRYRKIIWQNTMPKCNLKNLIQLEMNGNFLSLIKGIYENPTVKIYMYLII